MKAYPTSVFSMPPELPAGGCLAPCRLCHGTGIRESGDGECLHPDCFGGLTKGAHTADVPHRWRLLETEETGLQAFQCRKCGSVHDVHPKECTCWRCVVAQVEVDEIWP
jgi:hypothetical protein